jgi:hypothetical protein
MSTGVAAGEMSHLFSRVRNLDPTFAGRGEKGQSDFQLIASRRLEPPAVVVLFELHDLCNY